jgi:alcohol dehydrogenase class IV
VARALGATDTSGEGAAVAVEKLLDQVGLRKSLTEAGVKDEHLAPLVDKAMQDGCHGCNPRACSATDMESLFKAAW